MPSAGAAPRSTSLTPDDRRALAADLKAVAPETRSDKLTRIQYSTDASHYQIEPWAVVRPRDASEVAAAVQVAGRYGAPVIARGGGTSLAGQSIGAGVILDLSIHLHALDVDADAAEAWVEPGVVLDRLNRAAARHGLTFGPDPASADRACLGGVIGNNSTGAHSILYGMAADHLLAAEFVLADGRTGRFDGPISLEEADRRAGESGVWGTVHACLARLARDERAAVQDRFPKYWRLAGGYGLHRLLGLPSDGPPSHTFSADRRPGSPSADHAFDFRAGGHHRSSAQAFDVQAGGHRRSSAPGMLDVRSSAPGALHLYSSAPGALHPLALLAGSEGTLAVATAFRVRLVPKPPAKALLVAHFDDRMDPYVAIPPLLATGPSAIELVDGLLVDLARQAPGFAQDMRWVLGRPAAVLVVEYAGSGEAEVAAGMARGEAVLAAAGIGRPVLRAESPEDQAAVWRVRKAGLGILMRLPGDWKPVSGIEDTAVPPDRLAEYMTEVHRLLDELKVRAVFYAHASAGCLHIRPILNLKSADDVATLGHLMASMAALALRFGGVNSSEHGDGLARSAFNRQVFGDHLYGLFEEVKHAFDPHNLLNPGKIVAGPSPTEQLRYGPPYAPTLPAHLHFDYPADGDFLHAVEQCNGAGVCRKLDAGAMCPSFMVTLDEAHSTRGRANALRAVLNGQLRLDSADIHSAMDLCVGCKACRTECPSGVDMGRLKIEAAAAHVATHGAPARAHLVARLHQLDRWLSPVAGLSNGLLGSPLWRPVARALKLDPDRRFPLLAHETFDAWWQRRTGNAGSSHTGSGQLGSDHVTIPPPPPLTSDSPRRVVLFADTFTTFHEPAIGQATVALLEASGFTVISPPDRACCGRPALSQGLIDLALDGMRRNVALLAPFAHDGLPILVPEPSCASAFRDELPDLLHGTDLQDDARAVAGAVQTVDAFLAHLPAGSLPLQAGPSHALLHVHCHSRALDGVGPSLAALRHLPGLSVHEPDAGCCGMAGAFGHEVEHAAVAQAIAERKLAPAVRAAPADAVVVAAGMSCREQIRATTGREAVHPAVVLAQGLTRHWPGDSTHDRA